MQLTDTLNRIAYFGQDDYRALHASCNNNEQVLRKKGGKWLIVRDIWNSSTPPAAPATAAPSAPASAAAPKK